MNNDLPKTIVLYEYFPHYLDRDELPAELGEDLYKRHGKKITIDFPSPKTGHRWKLFSQGWIGFIPLSPDLILELRPRKGVALKNIVYMLSYAYGLKTSFQFIEGVIDCETLDGFFDRLAALLARLVKQRLRRGLYKDYIERREDLMLARGSIDHRRMINRPWSPKIPCRYQNHTVDIEDNQILAWTLFRVLRTGLCSQTTRRAITAAFRSLKGHVTVNPVTPQDCLNRSYNSLNADYKKLHKLCYFFLENCAPALDIGSRRVVPFLIQTHRLFENFVFEWLKETLPREFEVRAQHTYKIDEPHNLKAQIDIVLFDRKSQRSLCVIDTKYKTGSPKQADLYQITFYALTQKCSLAILAYPVTISPPFSKSLDNIEIRSLSYLLEGDIEEKGQRFMTGLIDLLRAQGFSRHCPKV